MTRHLLWLVIGAAALACSGPGSGDDDDDDGGSSGESSGGSSGSKGGSSSTSSGGSTSGSGGATAGWYCTNIDDACVCVDGQSLTGDDCITPKPTCCFGATGDDGTNGCLCYPPDAAECALRGMTGYPSRSTCP